MDDGGENSSGMGVSSTSSFNTLKETALTLWAGKHLGQDGRLRTNLPDPVIKYVQLGYGGNAGITAAFFYFMMVDLYGYDPDSTLEQQKIIQIGKVKRPWIQDAVKGENADDAEELNWIGGLMREQVGNKDFYALSLEQLEADLQHLF